MSLVRRNLGSSSATWGETHTQKLFLGTGEIRSVNTDLSSVPGVDAADFNKTIPTANAVVSYIANTEAGGSIIITTSGKTIPIGSIAIVTLGGVTKLWTSVGSGGPPLVVPTEIVLDTFSTMAGGTEFKETVTGFTELQTGGGAGTVTIDHFTTSDATTSSFILTQNPQSEDNINVFIDGVYQFKDAYTVSGATLQFSTENPPGMFTATPLADGAEVEVLIGSVVNFTDGTLADVTATGTIRANAFAGDGAGLTGLVTGIPNLPDVANAETKSYHLQVTDDDDSPAENDDVGSWVENSAALEITGRGCTVETGSGTDPATLTTRAACAADLGTAGNGGTWVNGSLQLTVNGATATMTIETLLNQVSIDDLG